MNSPIVISYYGQVKSFSYTELQDGTFDNWLNYTYLNFKNTKPCEGVFTTTTTTTSTTTVTSLVNNIMNLNSITSLDLSSTSSIGSGTSVGSTTSSGTTGTTGTTRKNGSSNNKSRSNGGNNTTGNSSNNSSQGGESSGQGTNTSSEGQVGNNGSSTDNSGNTGSSGSSNSGSSSGSGDNSSNSSNSNGSSGSGSGGTTTDKKPEEKTPEQIEEEKSQSQQTAGSTSVKSVAKGKVETQKPAILVTGDIVGVQTVKDQAQDARGTMSLTKVKGDGTASFGLSADYMINAKIGNFNGMRSWMGANNKGHKHINVLSAGINFMPKSYNGSMLFVRVNSLKNFTALYGAAGSYGQLFEEEVISTLLIGGFMYKGKLSNHIDATIIAAAVYAPYTKYYTESLFESQPIIVPFLNINYSITKTFKFGLTGGGTYIANQDIVNYQILMGGKLKI